MRGEWDASVKAMVIRLQEMSPAKEGFELRSGNTVVDPVKYHEQLLQDAAAGPKGPRSRMGAFQEDLERYLKIRETQEKRNGP